MIRKLLILTLCLIVSSCGGISIVAGLKFKSSVDIGPDTGGNPNSLSDAAKLSNGKFIIFERPIGKCGGGVNFFGIILPIIPVWMNLNSCEKSFDVNISSLEISGAQLKYNNTVYEPVVIEKLIEHMTEYEYGKKFKFKIDNFWKFRMADDKAIIVSGKTKDGKEFTEELPVKWGVMTYYNWAFP